MADVTVYDLAGRGTAYKDSVRVATQSNTTLTAPGATIDGITMAAGDRVLVKAQSSTSANGIYIWNGASSTMTRAEDANSASALEAALVTVEEGTDAGKTFRQSSVNFTLGTDAVTWVSKKGAAVTDVSTADGSDAATTQALANALKVKLNALLASLRAAEVIA